MRALDLGNCRLVLLRRLRERTVLEGKALHLLIATPRLRACSSSLSTLNCVRFADATSLSRSAEAERISEVSTVNPR